MNLFQNRDITIRHLVIYDFLHSLINLIKIFSKNKYIFMTKRTLSNKSRSLF